VEEPLRTKTISLGIDACERLRKTRRSPGPAREFLAHHPEETPRVSVVTVGELTEEYEKVDAPELEQLLAPHEVMDVARPVARANAVVARGLRPSGIRWGDNDLWIAAAALEAGEPLLARDSAHLERISGLAVRRY
jgi:predicted nucleic acid-binding protein